MGRTSAGARDRDFGTASGDAARSAGVWRGDRASTAPAADGAALARALRALERPIYIVGDAAAPEVATAGEAHFGGPEADAAVAIAATRASIRAPARTAVRASAGDELPLVAHSPPLPLENLGDPEFRAAYGLRYAYVAGAMANGIGSVDLVEAMSRAGMLGFFGAAGLAVDEVAAAALRLAASLGDAPYGFNLIHSPAEPALEAAVVDLYLRRGVRVAEASAYLDLTPPVVRYRVQGVRRSAAGAAVPARRLIAKVSRVEVARRFLAPPPEAILRALQASGSITEEEALLAREIPMADDITAEADSGGHTDNRPAVALLPTMLALRDRVQREFRYPSPPRVGLAGGISTPHSAAAAFAMGAAYVVTGTVNQSCIEAGTSDRVRALLAAAEQADVAMAPAADMFEMGVKVQVLKRGTLFAMRAAKLYELYRAYASLDALPAAERANLENNFFRAPLARIWDETAHFFRARDPAQIERAERDPRHKMALVFRWYLGLSSQWANRGEESRQVDYQVWCGPAMGAFNEWTRGTFLAEPRERRAATVALGILHGAAVLGRAAFLRAQGFQPSASALETPPLGHDVATAILARGGAAGSRHRAAAPSDTNDTNIRVGGIST
ncbi:MAG: PfaD family polyunsaturated fatty acid/polyketide biosynthesis protein [Planctomycetes bacterium]|nr:PfaD family polyunsaturated fatty acid/polyketide biosynthesis protein [Planctomycetota bacterium]